MNNKDTRPNLFHWATSELSNDAFLCWLLSYANPDCVGNDQDLHSTAQLIIRQIFEMHGKFFPTQVDSIEIKPQYKNMDIVVFIQTKDVKYAILIEDKVGTREHSNQLTRYISTLEKEGFTQNTILPVYIQLGDQGDYAEVIKSGYKPLLRPELLRFLKSDCAAAVKNDIFMNYVDNLQIVEDDVQSFRITPVTETWTGRAWQGFFCTLQENLGCGNWSYVANPSGGFLGFWWHSNGNDDCEQYLALEDEKLCFKIWGKNEEQRRDLQQLWNAKIVEASRTNGLFVVKPRVLRTGASMTVAVLDGDYRQKREGDLIDISKTISVLKTAERILDQACQNSASSIQSRSEP